MKKTLIVLSLFASSLIAGADCKSNEVEIIKGNYTFCTVPTIQKTERICIGDFSMNPDDPTGTQCIKKPVVISSSDASTHSCPNSSTSISATECAKTEPMTATSIDSDLISTWHSYAPRDRASVKIDSKEGAEIITETNNANSSIPTERTDIECNEQRWMNGTINNLRYGMYGGYDNDKWSIIFSKIYVESKNDSVITSESFEPIAYDLSDGYPKKAGDTYPVKFVPTNNYSRSHDYYIVDSWDKLTEPTDIEDGKIEADKYFEQEYTANLLNATIRLGESGYGEYARGNANNPFLTDKGYVYSLRRALEQMKKGEWSKDKNTIGEAGLCYSHKRLDDMWDLKNASCGAVGSKHVNLSFAKPGSSCDFMVSSEPIDTKMESASLTCCDSKEWVTHCTTCPEDATDCKVKCTKSYDCVASSTWTSAPKERKKWAVWTRSAEKQERSIVSNSECSSEVKNPKLQDDICIPLYSWDTVDFGKGTYDYCSNTVQSNFMLHSERASVPTYCSNSGVQKCGALNKSANEGTDFNYCSSSSEKKTEPTPNHFIESHKWWGWDSDIPALGITKSEVSTKFRGARDLHNQCQKGELPNEMNLCDLGIESCEAANNALLAAELKATQEELINNGDDSMMTDDGSGFDNGANVSISDNSNTSTSDNIGDDHPFNSSPTPPISEKTPNIINTYTTSIGRE